MKLGVKLGVNEQLVFDLIKKNPALTIANMAKTLGISTTSVENNLNKLKNRNLIKREGSTKNGYFMIVDHKGLGGKLGAKLGVNEQKILDILKVSANSSIVDMANEIGISTTAVENNLRKLKDKQIIKREGSDKTGRWVFI